MLCKVLSDKAKSDLALLYSHLEPQDDLACLVYDPSLYLVVIVVHNYLS